MKNNYKLNNINFNKKMEIKNFCDNFDMFKIKHNNIYKIIEEEIKISIFMIKTYKNKIGISYCDNYYDIYSSVDKLILKYNEISRNPYYIFDECTKYKTLKDDYIYIIEENENKNQKSWLIDKYTWKELYIDRLNIKKKYNNNFWHPFDVTLYNFK